jgi:hypothetical protein
MNILTYSAWYDSPENDPRNGDYTGLYTRFDAFAAPEQPVDILNHVTTRPESKLAFVILGSDGMVRVLHRLRRYHEEYGEPPGLFGGKNFAIRGEITDWGATLVEVPPQPFLRTNLLENVPTIGAVNVMAAELPQGQIPVLVDPPADQVGPARSRYLMVIPPRLVGAVLTSSSVPEGLTPGDLWRNVAAPLWDDEVTRVSCAPFIEWCRIAYSHGVGEGNPLQLAVPQAVEPNPRLQQERINMARQDLPLRFSYGVQVADPALGQVVQALQGFQATYVGQNQAAAEREAVRDAASKLPSKRWPETYNRLLRICLVETEQALPPVWLAMAGQSAKQDRATISQYLSVDCEPQLGQSGLGDRAPEITADLATQLGQLRFISGPNDLDVGMSVFMISFPNARLASKISASAGLYDQQMQGNASFTMDEVVNLKKAQKFCLPTNFIEVKNVCWSYHRFLAVMLGFGHDVTKAFGKLVRLIETNEQQLHQMFDSSVHHCSGLLRFIQIEMHEWLSDTLSMREAMVPTFDVVVSEIKRQRWQVPSLPQDFLDEASAEAKPPAAAAMPARGLGSSNEVKAPPSALDTAIVPIQPDFAPYAFIKAHGNPPKNERNQFMCLNFHVKAECYKNCSRRGDHKRHSEADSKKLAKYLASTKP